MTTPAVRTENTGTPANGTLPAGSTKLALFDLDGVLFDTLAVMRVAWDRVRTEYGFRHLLRTTSTILGDHLATFSACSALIFHRTLPRVSWTPTKPCRLNSRSGRPMFWCGRHASPGGFSWALSPRSQRSPLFRCWIGLGASGR